MSFNKKTVYDVDVSGKIVLVRTDYNVTIGEDNQVVDDYRIRMTLPTIEYLLGKNAKVVILSHMGRPEGKKDLDLSLMPVASCLSKLMHLPVKFMPDITGTSAKKMVEQMPPKSVAVLENLRFWPGEEANDQEFAKHLASLGEIFVEEGFAAAYREHASIVGVAQYLPAVAGLLVKKEMDNLDNKLQNPARPVSLIIGGKKVADKLPVIDYFIEKSDFIAVGGVIGNTFLAASGLKIGGSEFEKDYIDQAKVILDKARQKMLNERFTFLLPKDVVTTKNSKLAGKLKVVDLDQNTWADITSYPKTPIKSSHEVAQDEQIMDIGPMTAATVSGAIKLSKTAIWCGPLGATEIKGFNNAEPPFSHGSRIVAESFVGEQAGLQNKPYSIVGGGNTLEMLKGFNLNERFNFLSTGGGACLQVLSGKKLAGIEVLLNKDQ